MNQDEGMAESQLDTLNDGSIVSHKSFQPKTCSAPAESPTIICFHGSGETATRSWTQVVGMLENDYSLILLDRASRTSSIDDHISSIREYLRRFQVSAPYILLAHSYGGTFAKQFLLQHREDVAGMVLVETGKSRDPQDIAGYPPWNAGKLRLGTKPLVVIRGDSLKQNQLALDNLEQAVTGEDETTARSMALQRRQMLVNVERQDEALEKAQLLLSSRHRYVHLPDCGHNVIRDRPDVVVREVQWVMSNLQEKSEEPVLISRRWGRIGNALSSMRRWRDRSSST